MKHQTTELVKFKRLVRELRNILGGSIPVDLDTIAVGILERLWHAAIREARDGRIGAKFSRADIAEEVGWFGDPEALLSALVSTAWLDEVDGILVVHDWDQHKPNWLKGVQSRGAGRVADHEPSTEPSSALGSKPSTEPSIVPSTEPRARAVTKPNQTRPNLTQPDQTRPDQTRAPPPVVRSGPVVDFGVLSERVDELREKLQRFPVKSLERDLAWRVVCLDAITRNGFASCMVERFRSREGVRKPASFVQRAIKTHCDEYGIDHAAFLKAVPPNHSEVFKPAREEMREHALAKGTA